MTDAPTRHPLRSTDPSNQAANQLSEALTDWLGATGPRALWRTCASCRHMAQDGPATCTLYGMTPPVAVIMDGCDSYGDEAEVPS